MDDIALLIALFFLIFVSAWVYRDAVSRGLTSGIAIVWAIAVFLIMIIALPLWLVFRPKAIVSPVVTTVSRSPSLCSDCGKYYEGSPTFCPNCGIKIS